MQDTEVTKSCTVIDYISSLLIFLLCIFLSPSPFINLSSFGCGKSRLATFYDLSIIRYCHNKDYVKMAPRKFYLKIWICSPQFIGCHDLYYFTGTLIVISDEINHY